MKKKKILIAILVCILLLVILLVLVNLKKGPAADGPMDGTTLEGRLILSGATVFSEDYYGEITSKEIVAKMQEVVKEDIPELHKTVKNYNDSKIKKYFKKNESDIKNKFGITNEDEFVKFANYVKNTEIDLDSWDFVKFDKDSFVGKSDKSEYAYVKFKVIYKDEQSMEYHVYVTNRLAVKPQYIFGIN